jgi:hypothetical protein
MERLPEPQQALVLWPFRQALAATPFAYVADILTHGKNPEPLPVASIVDDSRLREFLLAPLQLHVHDLMDHQFVTLVVTADQKTAVETFRSEPDNLGLGEPGVRHKKTCWDKMPHRAVPHTRRYRPASASFPMR